MVTDNIINGKGYVVGISGRDIVLNTLGKVYIKVRDKYYLLDYNNTDSDSDIIVIKDSVEIDTMNYPGDNKIIISLDGRIYKTSNKKIKVFNITNESTSLTLDSLELLGQLTITLKNTQIPPLVINSKQLVKNLNAQYLNGYESKDFIINNGDIIVNGNWTFNNILADKIGNSDNYFDFNSGIIKAKKLIVNNTDEINVLSKTLLGAKTDVTIDVEKNPEFNNKTIINRGIACGYLNDAFTYDEWCTVFFDGDTPRDFTDSAQVTIANNILQGWGLSTVITDYSILYNNFVDNSIITEYTGSSFSISYSTDLPFSSILPGYILHLTKSVYGIITDIDETSIIVKLNTIVNIEDAATNYIVGLVNQSKFVTILDSDIKIADIIKIGETGYIGNKIYWDSNIVQIKNKLYSGTISGDTDLQDYSFIDLTITAASTIKLTSGTFINIISPTITSVTISIDNITSLLTISSVKTLVYAALNQNNEISFITII